MWRCSADRKSSTRHEAATACANTIGTVRLAPCKAATVGLAVAKITSGVSATLRREFAIEVCIASSPADIDPHIFAFGPAKFLQALPEGRNASLSYRIIRTRAHEHTEPPHAFGLLRARNEWNCGGTANKRDKFAPSHRRPDGQTPIWYRMMRWLEEPMSALGQKRTCAVH
jgi:hypothetical protein